MPSLKNSSPIKDLTYAFVVGVSVVKVCTVQQINITGKNKRKQRSDAGVILITSYKKQYKIWTPKHYFMKQHKILNGCEVLMKEKIDAKFTH